MTKEQTDEFMKNVRWSTVVYIAIAVIPMIIAFVWFLSGIKADVTATRVDVKDARTEAREQLTAAVTSINKRIDSIQYKQNSEIKEIWMIINPDNLRRLQYPKMGLFTQKMVNGKRIWIPYK